MGIFTRKKRFFLISPNFQGAFSRKIGQKGDIWRWVSGWDVEDDSTPYHFFSLFYFISQKVRTFGQKYVPLGENQELSPRVDDDIAPTISY